MTARTAHRIRFEVKSLSIIGALLLAIIALFTLAAQ